MFRALFRFLGLLLLAVGFVAIIRDGTRTIAGPTIALTKLGEDWYNVHPNSLLLAQPAVERHVTPWLWNPVIQTILEQPTWLVFGILGAIFILLGRRKKRLIGYARD